MDFHSGIAKVKEVLTMNAECNNGSIFVGPENVTYRLSCIINRYGGGGSVRRMADSDNEIGKYLNLMPNLVEGSSLMENEVLVNNSNARREFGYVGLVRYAIDEVDTNSIPTPKFSPLKHEDNKVDLNPHKRFLRKYGAALYPRNKPNFVHSTNGCCCLSGDWNDDSSKIRDCMNMKSISEALQIGPASHEVKTNSNLISENDIPKTFAPENDAAQPSQKRRKYVHSTDAYCCLSSDQSDNSSATREFSSSSQGYKFGVFSKTQTEVGILEKMQDYYLGGGGNLEEHVNDVIRRMN